MSPEQVSTLDVSTVKQASPAIEDQLARFASQARWDDLPENVQDYAETITADALANAVAGRSAETAADFESATIGLAGTGRHVVCGGQPLAAWAAAGQNAYQMTVHTMCDVYRPALCHVTPEVVPAALAAAELAGASGLDFLLAAALGLEVTTRVCQALDYPAFRARGWHTPGVAGALGAAAAAGRLFRLDAGAMAGCLGLAGAQAAGTFAAIGTVAVKFHQANGSRAGLSAAVYAATGFAGSPRILSHPDGGILRAYSGGGSPELGLAGLGESWELREISLRSYPAASTLQALVDCLLSVPARKRIGDGGADRVTVWLPPHAFRLGAGAWASQLAAMQSARFVAAAAIKKNECWLQTFDADTRSDQVITDFAAESVDVQCDEGLEEGGVRVLLAGGGEQLELRRDYPHGDSRDPLTRDEVRAKAARSLAAVLPPDRAGAALAAIDGLRTAALVTDVTGLLGAPADASEAP